MIDRFLTARTLRKVADMTAEKWFAVWSEADADALISGFRTLAVRDPERAHQLVASMQTVLADPVVQHFAAAEDEDELSPAEVEDEIRAVKEALEDGEWLSAEEARRKLIG